MVFVRRLALAVAMASVSVVSPALAHVIVAPTEVAGGHSAVFAFRCPNERPNAATVKLEVEFPQDHPIVAVRVLPIAGWTAKITTRKLATPVVTEHGVISEAIATVTWSGGHLGPDEFQDFTVMTGALPHGPLTLTFKAVQTYDNGEVVRWIQERKAGEAEPERPTPVLHVQ